MAIVREQQIALIDIEGKLTEKQNLLEKQKLEYDEKIMKKEYLITKVS